MYWFERWAMRRALGGVDPAQGDGAAERMRRELHRGRWQEASTFLAGVRDRDEREFYYGVLATWPQRRPEFLDRWCAAEPRSCAARTVRGIHWTIFAWDSRGSGLGSSVTAEGWGGFRERLERACEDLTLAANLDARDPMPWAMLVTVYRGMSRPEEAKRAFQEATGRQAECRTAHDSLLQCVAKKWYGSHEEMWMFARQAATGAPEGSSLPALLCDAHIEMALSPFMGHDEDDEENASWAAGVEDGSPVEDFYAAYLRQPHVREEILAAYKRSLGSPRYRQSKLTYCAENTFAFCLGLMGEKRLATQLFRRIGDRVTRSPWGYLGGRPRRAFRRVRSRAAA